MEAHALVARLEADVAFPFVCLLVSGGHNMLVIVHGVGRYTLLGSTFDDALGESRRSATAGTHTTETMKSMSRFCTHKHIENVSLGPEKYVKSSEAIGVCACFRAQRDIFYVHVGEEL